MKISWLLCSFFICSPIFVLAGEQNASFPGEQATWNGFTRYDFDVAGYRATVIEPKNIADGKPWVWHGEFFGHRPNPDIALLGRGYHIVYLKTSDLFGAPTAIKAWDQFYQLLTEKYKFAPKAAYVGTSRGGLYCYNWAAQYPERVACIYGDAPVCDLASWPFGKGAGPGYPNEVQKLLRTYQVGNEAALWEVALNPIDSLEPIAAAKIPLLHVYGDADTAVPWQENTGIIAERYRALGGEITLIAKPGIGHVHGLEDSTPIVEFIDRHCQSAIKGRKVSQRERRVEIPFDIGSRRELLVDRYLIAQLNNARLQLKPPRLEETSIKFDQAWEGPFAGYTTVLQDGDRYLMYYRGVSEYGPDGNENERTCLAISKDGINWERPHLGLYEFQGSRNNNIVLADAAPMTHNFCPFIDTCPHAIPEEKFKAIGGTGKQLWAYCSADGIIWKKWQNEPILTSEQITIPHKHLFDSQNLVFWSELEQEYVCYFRVWDGLRRIARATSPDFRNWQNFELMRQNSGVSSMVDGQINQEHLYTNQTFPYFRAPQLAISLAARFFPDKRAISPEEAESIGVDTRFFNDTSDAVFLTTRGGNIYDRTFLQAFIKPGLGARNWVSRTNYPALNVVQTGPAELSFYMNRDYAQPTSHIVRYSLRLDGFASLIADQGAGEMVTHPLQFSGDQLQLNYATSAGGEIRCELLHPDGSIVTGFSAEQCQPLIGNRLDGRVRWNSKRNLSDLVGQPVCMRIVMQDAEVFSFQFASH